ncbi:MAG: hypothetical protein BZ151_00900 [Desulfobacca sp. 4484_104]|nr:MAG: hypothetical protein BZ151_00900 [Desulfobacca sp. 4484_104]
MSRLFDLHDSVEKKYIFNSFVILVAIVELLIFLVTLIWQIDEGVFSEQVTVVPFPWKEYLLASFTAPIVMMFIFGLIIKGFDAFCAPPETGPQAQPVNRYQRLGRKWSQVSYVLGLLFLISVIYAIIRLEQLLPILQKLFTFLGLWATYVVIGLWALGLLYFPINLILRYRLQKKAMEYQYLLSIAQSHGLVLGDAAQQLTSAAPDAEQPQLDSSPESAPAAALEDRRQRS